MSEPSPIMQFAAQCRAAGPIHIDHGDKIPPTSYAYRYASKTLYMQRCKQKEKLTCHVSNMIAHRSAKLIATINIKPRQPFHLDSNPLISSLLPRLPSFGAWSGVAGRTDLPTGVMLFSLSTVAIAGPWLKKSTRMYVGAFPYKVRHSAAASPKLPTGPDGAFVVVMLWTSGLVMPKACSNPLKWFINGNRPDSTAADASPRTVDGRSGTHEKSERLFTSKGFSKTKVNSSSR